MEESSSKAMSKEEESLRMVLLSLGLMLVVSNSSSRQTSCSKPIQQLAARAKDKPTQQLKLIRGTMLTNTNRESSQSIIRLMPVEFSSRQLMKLAILQRPRES